MKHSPLLSQVVRTAHWLLVLYLAVMLSGCSFRPAALTPEEARQIQTRELSAGPEDIARAATTVLQDLHYSLKNIDLESGVITAERTSEYLLAPISRETVRSTRLKDDLGTFCLIAGTMAAVGVFLAWIFGDTDDDSDEEYVEHHPYWHHRQGPVIYDDSGADSYHYALTLTLEEIGLQQTRVRVSVQGEHRDASGVRESGPVEAVEFYTDFYNRLQVALNR